jgi:hypothetical protein
MHLCQEASKKGQEEKIELNFQNLFFKPSETELEVSVKTQ